MDSTTPPSTAEETESQEASSALAPNTAWDTATKRTVLIVLLVVGALIFWISRPVLPILIMAGPYRKESPDRRRVRRTRARGDVLRVRAARRLRRQQ